MKPFDPYTITPEPLTTVIEASAGTGKTTAIAAQTTRALAEGWVSIDQVMLVTFGSRASTELRTRLHDRLTQAIASAQEQLLHPGSTQRWDEPTQLVLGSGGDIAVRIDRLKAALLDLDRATIATTHQFCQTMLLELGVLVDHDPGSRFTQDLRSLAGQVNDDQYLRHVVDHGTSLWRKNAQRLTDLVTNRLEPLRAGGPDSLIQFGSAVRSRIEQRKRELGIHGFDDMVTRLHQALKADQLETELAAADSAMVARRLLSSRFRWVMIDEYQDTDSLQWEIARAAFDGHSRLVLIGDPKQAIYGFRGADVQAYLRAVASSSQPSTLNSNWRSGASIVDAIGDLFRHRQLGESIAVVDVEPRRPDRIIQREGIDQPAVQLRLMKPDQQGPLTLNGAFDLVCADVVAEVGRLLDSRYRDHGFNSELPGQVSPADISVLVRTNRNGERIRDALIRSGIQAVFSGAGSVFQSAAAHDWLILLETIDTPTVASIRRVALTSFFGHTVMTLSRLDDDDLANLALSVKEIGQVLHRSGVAAAFAEASEQHQLHARLLALDDGERTLTDLRHLAQLLHQQHQRFEGSIAGLASWLADQRSGASSDEGTRRLESDRRAVQIMTIHRAKGLDLPIVVVPEGALVARVAQLSEQPAVVHDPQRKAWIDLRPNRELQRQVVTEHHDEDLRLLYVALTRAKYALRLWWAPSAENTATSPLHRLLADRATAAQLPRVPQAEAEVLVQQAEDFAAAWADSALNPVTVAAAGPPEPRQLPPSAGLIVSRREFTRQIDHQWRRTSYSALTSGLHEATLAAPVVTDEPELEAVGDTETGDSLSTQVAAPGPTVISPMAAFPGGALFGTLVHAVLEDLDPHSDQLAAELSRASRAACTTYPIEGVDADALAAGLQLVVSTPLGALAQGRTLADYPSSDRLPELDFELPLAATTASAHTVGALAAAFTEHLPAADPLADYGARLTATDAADTVLAGWLTGSIDAVLRHVDQGQPRHLVIDYKTNRMPLAVGEELTVQHYGATAMAEAMMHSHYPLQALLYCVALHRFLSQRLPDYDPEMHLGGVGYLFVRGMAGSDCDQPSDMPWGVFSWRPPTALVLAANDIVGGRR